MFSSFNARALGLTLSADETLRLASEHGFGGVDLMVRDLVDQGVDLKALKAKMDDLGLKPGAFPFPFDWRVNETQFTDGIAQLGKYAKAASTLGLSRTATWIMPETPPGIVPTDWLPPNPSTRSVAFDGPWPTWDELHAGRLDRIVHTLKDHGIRLGLEILGPETARPGLGKPFIHRYDTLEAKRVEWQVSIQANIGVLLDTWHLYATGEPLAHALACGVENVVWVHVADLPEGDPPDRSKMIDAVRGLPGEHGAIDSRAALIALKAMGYDGPVTAEPLSRCRSLMGLSPEEVARAAAASLRAIWPD